MEPVIVQIMKILGDPSVMQYSEKCHKAMKSNGSQCGDKWVIKTEHVIEKFINDKLATDHKDGICTCDDDFLCEHRRYYFAQAIAKLFGEETHWGDRLRLLPDELALKQRLADNKHRYRKCSGGCVPIDIRLLQSEDGTLYVLADGEVLKEYSAKELKVRHSNSYTGLSVEYEIMKEVEEAIKSTYADQLYLAPWD